MRRFTQVEKTKIIICSIVLGIVPIAGIIASNIIAHTTHHPIQLAITTPQPTNSMPPELRDSINREAIYGLSNEEPREP